MEFVESNAYWQNWKFKEKPNDTIWVLDKCIQPNGMLSKYGKPVIIGEYGGDVFKNPSQRLEAQLHAGTWAMAMMP